MEATSEEYIENLLRIIKEIYAVLKPTGSFWLNLGDSYHNKELLGIPWKVAFAMMNEQGWILRNSIIWNKHKGGMNATKDRFANIHENLFFCETKKAISLMMGQLDIMREKLKYLMEQSFQPPELVG